jgi:branched-chain amino acid transport system permease protein
MSGTGFWIVGTAAVVGAGIVAVFMKRILMRPIHERYPQTIYMFVALMGVSRFFDSLFFMFSDRRFMFQPNMALSSGITRSMLSIITFAVVIILFIGLQFFLKKTKWGAAIRAIDDNHRTAEIMGISVSLLFGIIFLIAGGLAAIGGFLSLLIYQSWINPTKALLAALAGGLGSLPGAVIGSLILGTAEVFSISFLSAQGDTVVSFLLIIVILVRYAGFFKKIFIRNRNV